MTVPYSWTIYVRLRWPDGSIPTNQEISQIRAFESYEDAMVDLCAAGVEANGMCTLSFGRESFYPPRTRPTLTIKVYGSSGELLFTSQEFAYVANYSTLDVVVEGTGPSDQWQVTGTVYAPGGAPLTEGKVRAYDIYDGQVTQLGSDFDLGAGGTYDINYTDADFGKDTNHPAPNLQIRVFDLSETLLGESNVISGASQNETVDMYLVAPDSWKVSGAVFMACGGVLTEGNVEAYDMFNYQETLLGTCSLNQNGLFEITYSDEDFGFDEQTHPAPNLLVRVKNLSGELIGESSLIPEASKDEYLDIFLEGDVSECEFCVQGTIKNELSLPVSDVTVKAYHLALSSGSFEERLLGANDSGEDGYYKIHYSATDLGAPGDENCCGENGAANLFVKVFDGTTELARSQMICAASQCPTIDLTVDRISGYDSSEYKRLNEAITPCVGDPPGTSILQAIDGSKEKQQFISCQIKWGTSYVANYVRAHLICNDINEKMVSLGNPDFSFPTQVIYALIRENLGTTLAEFLEVTPTTVFGAITSAIQAQIIASSFQDNMDDIMADWRAIVAALTVFTEDGAEDSWQKELLDIAIPDDQQSTVLEIYFDTQGDLDDFYDALRDAGISDDLVDDIKFYFGVFELTGRWLPLVQVLKSLRPRPSNNWQKIEDMVSIGIDDRPDPDDPNDPPDVIYGWKNYIGIARTTSGTLPEGIPPGTNEERIEIYATRLYNKLRSQFPQDRFKVDIKEATTLPPDMVLVRDFLTQYDDYSLDYDNIEAYSEANGISPSFETIKNIKETQRLYRLTKNTSSVVALHEAGLDSAFKISRIDEKQFIADYESVLGGLTEAKRIHRISSHLAAEILFYLGKFHQSLNTTGSGAALPDGVNLDTIADVVNTSGLQTMPNWITLFGDFNRCASEHCETVFSPAAYLVDLLEFVGAGAKDTLLERRPDLAEIELTCPNTNRVMPYIDLVNEILENAILPLGFPLSNIGELNGITKEDGVEEVNLEWSIVGALASKGFEITKDATVRAIAQNAAGIPITWIIEDVTPWRYRIVDQQGVVPPEEPPYWIEPIPQTSEGNESLEVYPEHINAKVYDDTIAKAVFPFNLPLDLAKEEIALILNHKGTPYHQIREALSADALETKLAEPAVARAYLNLSDDEAKTIGHIQTYSGTTNPLEDWKYWGFQNESVSNLPRPDKPTLTESGSWVEIMSMMPFFMDRTGLSYEEVRDVIDTDFVNAENLKDANGDIIWLEIDADDQAKQLCNINEYTIINLETTPGVSPALNRISTFVRLWKKLGWEIRELDQFLMDFAPADVTTGLVDFIALHHVQRLHDTLGVPVRTLLSWWRPMDTKRSPRIEKSLFDEVFLVGNKDEDQYKNLDLLAKGELTEIDISAPGLIDYEPTLRAALGVSPEAYELLLNERTALGIVDLSEMHAIATAAKALGIKVEEYYMLGTVLDEAFVPVRHERPEDTPPVLPGRPSDTIIAERNLDKLKQSGLSISELGYLLRHDSKEGDAFVPTPEDKAQMALALNQAMKQINEALSDERTVDAGALSAELAYVLPADQVALAMKIIEGPAEAAPAPVITTLEMKERLAPYVDSELLEDAIPVIEGPIDDPLPQTQKDDNLTFIRTHFAEFFPIGEGSTTTPQEDELIEYNPAVTPADRYRLVLRYLDLAFIRRYFAAFLEAGTITDPSDDALKLVDYNPTIDIDETFTRGQDLDERYNDVWNRLLPYLREVRKFVAARDVLSQTFGVDASLTSGLLEAPEPDDPSTPKAELKSTLIDTEPAGNEWKAVIEGGWMRFDDDLSGTRHIESTSEVSFKTGASRFILRAFVCPVEDGTYRFTVGGNVDPDTCDLKVADETVAFNNSVMLKAGNAYAVLLEGDPVPGDNPTEVSLLWSHGMADPAPIPKEMLIPADELAYLRFHKAALVIDKLSLDANLIQYLTIAGATPPIFDFNSIAMPGIVPSMTWDYFSQTLDVVALNRQLGLKRGSPVELLLSFFGKEKFEDEIVIDEESVEILKVIEDQTGWPAAEVDAIVKLLESTKPVGEFAKPDDAFEWIKLKAAMDVISRLKVPVSKVSTWLLGDTEPTLAEARNLRNVLKSQYSSAVWKDVFKPLRDPLRQKQRDALVGYLLSNPDAETEDYDGPLFFSENDLYSHFLIDTEMEPDVLTSRIKLAISAVQLFVHRVFLGYEPETALPENAREQWKWMKNYRVWEANRKVFLYPENWIEPELRDDKSEAFLELESELLQEDATDEKVEIALHNYLETLEDLSNLEVVGSYRDEIYNDKLDAVLHVVAKTKSDTRTYYYRKYIERPYTRGFWTPWVKIDLEINSDVVMPVVFNSRLFLVWPMFQEKQKMVSSGSGESPESQYFTEVKFSWSEYVEATNKWKKPRISKSALYNPSFGPIGREPGNDKPDGSLYSFKADVSSADYFSIRVYQNEFVLDLDEDTLEALLAAAAERLRIATDAASGGILGLWMPDEWKVQSIAAITQATTFYTMEVLLAYQVVITTARAAGLYEQNTRDIGEIQIWQDNNDTRKDGSLKTIDISYPTGAKIVHNAALETTYQINKKRSNGHLYFPKNNLVFDNTPGNFKLISTNFDFANPNTGPYAYLSNYLESRFNLPFFYQTNAKTLFGEHLSVDSVGGLSTQHREMYRFEAFHHPLVREFQKQLKKKGMSGLMNRLTQAMPRADNNYNSNYANYAYGNYYGYVYLGYHIAKDHQAKNIAQNMFALEHGPSEESVAREYPYPTVEFGYGRSFGIYNWELFFHAPLLIADRLRQNRQYADAMKWLHYIFDPGRTFEPYELTRKFVGNLPDGCKYWTFLPFFANPDATQSLLQAMGLGDMDGEDRRTLLALIQDWKNDPFKPHLIARSRIVAYQKTVVMKYLDNLIEWADQLFRMDTIESINEATQLYMVAAEILGDRPEKVECDLKPVKYTYGELAARGLDDFSNAIVDLEDALLTKNHESSPPEDGSDSDSGSGQPDVSHLAVKMFYFRVPMNEKLLTYFDTVQDRLFKIRNSMNIDGIKRQLPLFQPPIDPAMLVKAAAAGLDLGSILQQLNAPMPYYRFSVWLQKALDLANEVKSFGGAILSALEKKDAEDLSLLRSGHEIKMLELAREVKKQQIAESQNAIKALQKSKVMAETRRDFYRDREEISKPEENQRKLLKKAGKQDNAANSLRTVAGFLGLIPQFHATFPPDFEFGGVQISGALNSAAQAVATVATSKRNDANLTGISAGYDRRLEDWDHQEDLANKEIKHIEQQIVGAEIRLHITEKELDNHDTQIEQTKEALAFMKDKFTNRELYHWMLRELSATYSKMYKLAYDVAKTAERTYQFELGQNKASFIEFSYLDSLKKDLLAGEKLAADLKRMDIAYLENNKREFEITKPISLSSLNGYALQTLRETGACEFDVPELAFDLDFPGQYFRRIKAVRLTIPCVTGPNTSVSAKLTLLSSNMRKRNIAGGDGYAYQGLEDPRFVHDLTGIQSIATSNGQNDAGMFELNFRDERYLPFEGAGAISRWKLELPNEARQFDYSTISDVVVNMSYTARDGGDALKEAANADIDDMLNRALKIYSETDTGLYRVFSLRKEFPNVLHALRTSEAPTDLKITLGHFPYFLRNKFAISLPVGNPDTAPEIAQRVIVQTKNPVPDSFTPKPTLSINSNPVTISWSKTERFHSGEFPPNGDPQTLFVASDEENFPIALSDLATADDVVEVEDIIIVFNYTIAEA